MIGMVAIASFWLCGVIIPIGVSARLYINSTDESRQGLPTLAMLLTLKPATFAVIGFVAMFTLYALPVLGLIVSLAVMYYFSHLLFGKQAQAAAWLLVILDWVRLLMSMYVTYTFNMYVDAHYILLLVTFIMPTIFAVVAYTIASNKKTQHKTYFVS